MQRYKKSLEYLARARKVIPGGAQTLSKMAARFPEGAFPVAVNCGQGARVRDLDGHWYVDWICGLGAITLGYSRHLDQCDAMEPTEHEMVNAVGRQIINSGLIFSLPHPLEVTVAERLCQKIPCAEMVRFVNSGSEATEAAVRTARIATGRDIILTVKSGYHGWFSWFQCIKDWHPGVPRQYEKMIQTFNYNDTVGLGIKMSHAADALLESDKIAAVIMEPCLFEPPQAGFLQEVRDLCTAWGALLIFDETVTGFRWTLAGGQEYFGVTPDLATFGKGMANGLPIGALVGKREYMQHAELISGTFGGNALSLAAVNAVLDVYEQEPVIDTMWRRGRELQQHFNGICAAGDYPWAVCDGYACKPRIRFTNVDDPQKAMTLFLQVCAQEGVLFHPGGFNVSYALTDADMAKTFVAVELGLEAVAKAVVSGDWSAIQGKLCQPVVTVRG